jgi:S-formylglutathione hydrolase FrmB
MTRRYFVLSIVACLFAAGLLNAETRVRTLSHFSRYLQKEQSMNVIIPSSAGTHAVLYLLHGATGDYRNWDEKTGVAALADQYGLLIVMPDGGPFSWYTDSPFIPESQYESYIVRELIPFIDSTFDTFREKKGRGVCGLSMGGYGAIKLGLKYPELFASASSMSGVLAIMNHISQWKMTSVFGQLSDSTNVWKKNDLLQLLLSVRDTIALKFDTGLSDFVLGDNRAFLAELQRLGFALEYAEFPGSHNWGYWGTHISDHLQFHARMLNKSH